MENEDSIKLNQDSRSLFRSSAIWMRTFAILSLIAVVLSLLYVAIASSSVDELLNTPQFRGLNADQLKLVKEFMVMLIIGFAIFVLIWGFASSQLLKASNGFTATSYDPKKKELTESIKSLKLYWKYYGIAFVVFTIIIIIAFVILFIRAKGSQ